MVGWLYWWLVGLWRYWAAGWLGDRLVCWMDGWLVGWSVGWLVGWLVYGLVCILVGPVIR